jgi:hypothetical protein
MLTPSNTAETRVAQASEAWDRYVAIWKQVADNPELADDPDHFSTRRAAHADFFVAFGRLG